MNRCLNLLKVKYSKKRRAPDQGPFENHGDWRCHLYGIIDPPCRCLPLCWNSCTHRWVHPLWSNESGNHTWVEVWDGDWLFTGAAEQSPEGFNRGWFVGNASQAVKDDPSESDLREAVFKKTGLTFPLSWARDVDYVNAINVTERYTAKVKPVVIPDCA